MSSTHSLQEPHCHGRACRAQIVITIGPLWPDFMKYSSLAYGLILKDVGVLIQTLYLAAADMGLVPVRSGASI